MVNLSLTEEELNVVWYALNSFSYERRESAELAKRCALITGSEDLEFISSLLKEAKIADKLRHDCTRLTLNLVTD